MPRNRYIYMEKERKRERGEAEDGSGVVG